MRHPESRTKSGQISPEVESVLRGFAERSRRLAIWRAVIAFGVVLPAGMALVAALDWGLVLEEKVRWLLSLGVYAIFGVIERHTIVSLWKRPSRSRDVAVQIEACAPELKGDLLAAVELSGPNANGSPQFRALVQERMAARITAYRPAKLLPFKWIHRHLWALGGLAVALGLGFLVSGVHFPRLMARAFLPGANLARVSRVQIDLLEPSPAEGAMPFGETVPVRIATSGAPVQKAFLDVFPMSGGRQTFELESAASATFSGILPVGREDLMYRVRAGDAMTRRFRLQALPRPRVTNFEKLYRMPSYVGGERRVVEADGELSALEGSEVTLRMEVDMPVKKAWLEIGSEKSQVPLERESAGFLTGTIPMRGNSSYRVRLVAEETGFENKFSPEYAIRVTADQVPQVEWLAPSKDALLGPQEDLELKARASDDVGLSEVSLVSRLNEGPWSARPWTIGPGGILEQRWDPVDAGAARGDLITLKLRARDLRGGVSESRPLRVTLAGDGFDSRQVKELQQIKELVVRFQELRASAVRLESAASAWRNAEAKGGIDSGSAQKSAAARTALEEWQGRLQAAREEAVRVLKQTEPGPLAGKISGLLRVLGRLEASLSSELDGALDGAGAATSPELRRDWVQKFGQAAVLSEQKSRVVLEAGGVFLGGATLDAACVGLMASATEVSRLKERVAAGAVPGLDSRLRALVAEGAGLDELLASCAEQVPGGGERVRSGKVELGKLRAQVEKEGRVGGAVATEVLVDWLRGMRQMLGLCLGFSRESGIRQDRSMQELGRHASSEWRIMEGFRADLDRISADRKVDEARRSEVRAILSARGQRSFKADGDAEETRPGSDPQFVGDLRLALSVFKGMTLPGRVLEAGYHTEFERVEACLRVLECGHRVLEAAEAAAGVYANERWEGRSFRAGFSSVRAFEWMQGRLRDVNELAAQGGRDTDLTEILGVARREISLLVSSPAMRAMENELRDRFQPGHAVQSLESSGETVYGQLVELLVKFREPMDRCRAELLRKVPGLNERMAALAAETAALQTQTQARVAFENAANQNPESKSESKTAMTALRDRQERLNAEVDALRDVLRAQANREDLNQKEGRERARDADDALALLREPPVRAADALEEGVRAGDSQKRKEAAETAAKEQGKLAAALQQLAQHYSNPENSGETRAALRAAERDLGVQDALNEQYAKAEKMAELSKKTPAELLEHLEKQLPQNRIMQVQLSQISRIGVEESAARVQEAAGLEERMVDRVRRAAPVSPVSPSAPSTTEPVPPSAPIPAELAEAAAGQHAVAEAAGDAGQTLERSGRHEKRLQNMRTSEQLSELGKELSELATTRLPQVQKDLLEAKADASERLESTARRIAERAEQLKKMPPAPSPALRPLVVDSKSNNPEPMTRDSMQPAYPVENNKPSPQEQVWMARTLDALDSQIFGGKNSENKAGQSGKPGESGAKGEQQAGADSKGDQKQGEQKQAGKSQDGQSNSEPGGKQNAEGQGESGNSKQMADKARSAMAAAARAAAESMRAKRNEADAKDAGGQAAKDSLQSKSGSGSSPDATGGRVGELPIAKKGSSGDWGRLPKKMAEELSQVRREEVSAEYREQVETYYRVLSERAKK